MQKALISPDVAVNSAIDMVQGHFTNEREKNAVVELLQVLKNLSGNFDLSVSAATANVFNEESDDEDDEDDDYDFPLGGEDGYYGKRF